MNKQELLKQADYNFQRGNRDLAKKYLADLLNAYPNEESAWILLAKVVDEKERKIECYERALKINPANNEVKLAFARLKNPQSINTNQQVQKFFTATLRGISVTVVVLFVLGTTTYAIARSNPGSPMAKLFIPATATPIAQTFTDDVAAQTRAEISSNYPQYTVLVDSLISLAITNTENGMEGAPERPGTAIIPSNELGDEARMTLEQSLPQPGSLTSVSLNEQQLTSWLAMELQNSPDLPLNDIQVYLRDDKVQIWSMVEGPDNSTSALIVGTITIDGDSKPYFEIESVQIGQQVIPDFLLSQAESWINESLAEEIDNQAPGLRIMNINISSGLITVSGMR
jgi:tetratricopeptide (TPR) repeat protein